MIIRRGIRNINQNLHRILRNIRIIIFFGAPQRAEERGIRSPPQYQRRITGERAFSEFACLKPRPGGCGNHGGIVSG